MRHVAPVAIDRRHDLGDAFLLQRAARALRLAESASSNRVAGGNQAVALRHQAGRVAHRGHLDAGLGAVDERVEHLRIDRVAVVDLQILVEDVPDIAGRRLVIVRLVARAFAGRDHLEAAGARPIDMLADQRRLIAPGEAVDHARFLRLAREQRARERIRLDVDHDDMLAVGDRLEACAMPACGTPVASTITSMPGQAISASASSVTCACRA